MQTTKTHKLTYSRNLCLHSIGAARNSSLHSPRSLALVLGLALSLASLLPQRYYPYLPISYLLTLPLPLACHPLVTSRPTSCFLPPVERQAVCAPCLRERGAGCSSGCELHAGIHRDPTTTTPHTHPRLSSPSLLVDQRPMHLERTAVTYDRYKSLLTPLCSLVIFTIGLQCAF